MSQPEAMSCAEAEPLLPLVADGALDPDSDPALFAHLAACPACQRVVALLDLVGLFRLVVHFVVRSER
ncbi:MAG: zf-HC2 domain-containing protein [Planctomycetes bacterium]|nr:zf-HC2 domain-containing protein [Planctomycetota bacterium]